MPLSAPEYWLEWTINYFRCQFTHIGGLIHKKNAPQSTPIWFVAFWKFDRALGGLTTAFSVFVNSTNITTNIETAVLSKWNRRKLQNEQNWFLFGCWHPLLLRNIYGSRWWPKFGKCDHFVGCHSSRASQMPHFCPPPCLQGNLDNEDNVYTNSLYLWGNCFSRQHGN